MPLENYSKTLRSKNTNCAGCGMSIVHNLIGDALGDNIKMAIPACCAIVAPHSFPNTCYKVPVAATTFASSSVVASGMKAIQTLNDENINTIAFAGDGGTFDIGMATLSGCAERNEDIIYVCYDNEVYGNTGAQRSSATPVCAVTTTTPTGKKESKKDIMSILVQHNIPYAATMSIGHPDDFIRKMKVASEIKGFRFLYVLSPCIPNWKIEPAHTIKLARLAVQTGVFPLYEVFNRNEYHITEKTDELLPLEEYLDLQKRFAKAGVEAREELRSQVLGNWNRIQRMAETFPPGELTEKYLKEFPLH
ncbi:MAG: pyruvate synthase subunit beta [bacterium]|nr:pyruvate synthase subunit beta [bacterium]